MSLSLSPRLDLIDFTIPSTFIPQELRDKYNNIISKKSPAVLTNAMDYLNESIVGLSLPGIQNLTVVQPQISYNSGMASDGHLVIEPHHENKYMSAENPLTKMDTQITVSFRHNQGLLNYFLLYETAFHRYCRPQMYDSNDVFTIYLKGEDGKYISKILLYQPEINSIDGLEFAFSKVERAYDNFNVVFDFNNIDFDFMYQD